MGALNTTLKYQRSSRRLGKLALQDKKKLRALGLVAMIKLGGGHVASVCTCHFTFLLARPARSDFAIAWYESKSNHKGMTTQLPQKKGFISEKRTL
jgi:hypothetical protein